MNNNAEEKTTHIQDVVINEDYKISVFQKGIEITVSLKQIDIDETIEGYVFELPEEKFS